MQQVEKLLERVAELPFSPVAAKILELSQDDRVGAREIANVVARDQAFTARLLKVANSPYYGQARPVTTVTQAVPVLGINTISSLALAFMSFSSLAADDNAVLTLGEMWEHSIGCASWGRQIAKRIGHPASEETFTAGLLHDMGKALFYRFFKTQFLDAVTRSVQAGISLQEAERCVLDTDHAAAGAAVARKWNLPAVLLNAIEHHHRPLGLPADIDVSIQRTVAIVHVADMLADASEIGRGIESAPEMVDQEVWQLLEIDLDSCKELLDDVLEEVNTFRRIFDVRGRSKKSALWPRPQLNSPSGAPNGPGAGDASPRIRPASASQPLHPMMIPFARFMEAGKQLALLAGLEDLLPKIAAQTMNLLSADAAHVLIPQSDALTVAGAAGLTYLKDKQLPVDGSLAGWVFKVGEKRIVTDIEKTQPCWEKKFFTVAGFRAHLIIPVEWAGKRLAVLSVHHRQERAWSPQEISLADMFAGLAAVALENARLYEEAEHKANALERLNKQLTEALHVKSRFLATVSHELRSPLTVITGYANLMADEMFGPLPAKISEPVDKIIKHGNRLMSLINSILEVSEMDAGSFNLQRDCCDLRELLDEVSICFAGLLGNNQVVFETDYELTFSAIVTDRKRLQQILGHLLDNAVKFTRAGKIVLRARSMEGGFEIVVEDTGIGIDPEQQKIIFDGFRQVEQEDNRRFEGIGLGLYLARRLTDLLGGTISVASRIGEGTRFCVRLPCGEVSASDVHAAH